MKLNMICHSILLSLAFAGSSFAASPPLLINYQGVLRDNLDTPLTGPKDMVFRFYNFASGGSVLLTDSHTTAGGNTVTVSGGLFTSQLGNGTITAGTSASLSDLFRDNATVYLEVQVGAETLSPRTKIVAAAYAPNASNLEGKPASGFIDTSAAFQAKVGALAVGSLQASGSLSFGVTGSGPDGGGYFSDSNESGVAFVGYGNYGIDASGTFGGAHFTDSNNSGAAFIGFGDTGIQASGTFAGASFTDSDGSGRAYVAYGDTGIDASGYSAGGHFEDSNGSGDAVVGFGDFGIDASGNQAGGFFADADNNGSASVGTGYDGIHATGASGGAGNNGGYFNTGSSSSTEAFLANWNNAVGGTGVAGYGNYRGGYFRNTVTGSDASVGVGTYKIFGTGFVSFVQNHPVDKDRVIVYAAPEGDEVATYTRGTAKLVDGEARVRLGETFQWVTNPDIGLSAFVTPRGKVVPLAVISMTPAELVVRGPAGSDVTFDFMVYGLRIGFEEASVVQEKHQEERIPSMVEHRRRYEAHPELRHFDALARYERMDADTKGGDAVTAVRDMSASKALHDAIEEYDPAVHGPVPHPEYDAMKSGENGPARAFKADGPIDARGDGEASGRVAQSFSTSRATRSVGDIVRFVPTERRTLVVAGAAVEMGDVLVVDSVNPETMKLSDRQDDPTVVGVVAPADGASPTRGRVPVAEVGSIVLCKVDAGYGAIRPGDLLTSSPTAGHAMRSVNAAPGTVIGKALETLESGSGSIRILVMLR